MSNLGDYQTIVEEAKKVGGPRVLVQNIFDKGETEGIKKGIIKARKEDMTAIIIIGGFAYFGRKIYNKIKTKSTIETKNEGYSVLENHFVLYDKTTDEGVVFKKGMKIEILSIETDSILLNIVGDYNSPYCVSPKFLESISRYKHQI